MNVIVEPTEYFKLLLDITQQDDHAVTRDPRAYTWELWHDGNYWAKAVTRPLRWEEELLEPTVLIEEASMEWFMFHRPLAILWKPGMLLL